MHLLHFVAYAIFRCSAVATKLNLYVGYGVYLLALFHLQAILKFYGF